jgi:ABC-type multidrug transport system permease subunit
MQTIKELLLSPAPRWALFLGKTLGIFFLALAPSGVVLLVLVAVFGTWPAHWPELVLYALLTLLIFSALGALLGMLAKQRRNVTTLTLGTLVPLFFVSGPLGPVSFSTPAIQAIASFSPATYAIVGEQYAFHDFATNTLGAWNLLVLVGFALAFAVAAVAVLRRGTATQ